MGETKTITINPGLLNKKTKKLISPKLINKTLIKRIKEKREKIEPKPFKSGESKFDESNNFLSNILQKHPKTLKVHTPLDNYNYSPINKSVENLLFKPDTSDALNINYKLDTEVLYGNLRRGLKPTLKNWKLGKKITFPTQIKEVKYSEDEEERRITESEINKEINGKTEFSTDLLKSFQIDEKITISDEDVTIEAETLEMKPIELKPIELNVIEMKPIELNPIELNPIELNPIELNPIELNPIEMKPIEKPIEFEKPRPEPMIRIKPNLIQESDDEPEQNRTVKKRYNVGRIKGKGEIGLIISNKTTRKNVAEFIKKMKLTPSDVMKKELKKQGLIQVGSSAPNEVIKKIYESSQLAGDIFNENKEVLINNLLNDN